MLVSLIGIFIIKRRRNLKNQYDLKTKSGFSDSGSVTTNSSTSESQKTFGLHGTSVNSASPKCEWKTFWPFGKKDNTTNDKPFVKQDYEVCMI